MLGVKGECTGPLPLPASQEVHPALAKLLPWVMHTATASRRRVASFTVTAICAQFVPKQGPIATNTDRYPHRDTSRN